MNVDLQINAVAFEEMHNVSKDKFAFYTYIKVAKGTSEIELQRMLQSTSDITYNNEKQDEYLLTEAVPLTGIHYLQNHAVDTPKGNITFVYIFIGLAILLTIIVLVNITNLSTLKAVDRIKPMAINKVLGANKTHIAVMFF